MLFLRSLLHAADTMIVGVSIKEPAFVISSSI